MTVSATRFDPRVLGVHSPRRAKIAIEIDPIPSTGDLSINLGLPLDLSQSCDRDFYQQFALNPLRVVYTARDVDLEAERESLWQTFADRYRSNDGRALRAESLAPLDRIALNKLLFPLATQGASLYRRLFNRFNDLHTGLPQRWNADIIDLLRQILKRPLPICIYSQYPLFPWSFLYHHETQLDDLDPGTLSPRGFWGFQREIQQEVEGTSRGLRLPAAPRVVAAVCPDADPRGDHSAVDSPLTALGEQLRWVRNARDLRDVLRDFDAHCFYFYGHAHHDCPPTPAKSWLKLQGIELSVAALAKVGAPKFRPDLVLVFLNGCRTGQLHAWDRNTVAGYLALASDHQLCLVTAVAEVPVAFASGFASAFWRRFIGERATIGTALLSARRDLLDRYQNPLGLLYQVFGRIDTYIDMEEAPLPGPQPSSEAG